MHLAAGSSGGSALPTLLFLGLMAALMYFMIIRPQSKRRREAMELQRNVSVGDEVITIDAMHATVAAIDGDQISLEIAPGVVARFERAAVARVVKAPAAEPEAETAEETDADDAAAHVVEQGR
ncbi:preprotein translocase subunit YajC [Hamadaea tsunoensis]|uniref:preprotein translocase subunit YajC n=1 Tax=Hamadaea tsunoensis TaxID=53368 RepID=UPI00040D891A|nr:preprotein translocase subunit YajC [Hamadaea tsunoensis]